jgi:hypothetical protein
MVNTLPGSTADPASALPSADEPFAAGAASLPLGGAALDMEVEGAPAPPWGGGDGGDGDDVGGGEPAMGELGVLDHHFAGPGADADAEMLARDGVAEDEDPLLSDPFALAAAAHAATQEGAAAGNDANADADVAADVDVDADADADAAGAAAGGASPTDAVDGSGDADGGAGGGEGDDAEGKGHDGGGDGGGGSDGGEGAANPKPKAFTFTFTSPQKLEKELIVGPFTDGKGNRWGLMIRSPANQWFETWLQVWEHAKLKKHWGVHINTFTIAVQHKGADRSKDLIKKEEYVPQLTSYSISPRLSASLALGPMLQVGLS